MTALGLTRNRCFVPVQGAVPVLSQYLSQYICQLDQRCPSTFYIFSIKLLGNVLTKVNARGKSLALLGDYTGTLGTHLFIVTFR